MDISLFNDQFEKFVTGVKINFDLNFKNKLRGISEGTFIRGNNPSLSNIVEDKFAEFLYQVFRDKNYLFLIDVNLSTKYKGESKAIRPDIIVIERNSNAIKGIFEIKIDDARADDDWVKLSEEKLEHLKAISKSTDAKNNYIQFTTIKIDEYGNPLRSPKGRIRTEKHKINCSQEAKIACITLCRENSRKREDSEKFRTEGELALYISEKHFNNQNHTMQDILDKENLNKETLFEILEKVNI